MVTMDTTAMDTDMTMDTMAMDTDMDILDIQIDTLDPNMIPIWCTT